MMAVADRVRSSVAARRIPDVQLDQPSRVGEMKGDAHEKERTSDSKKCSKRA